MTNNKRDPISWKTEGLHLPEFLRDFHDQKDVFKFLGEVASRSEAKHPDWITAHCYTIDIFLWVMASYGWTMQRSRSSVNFGDLDEAIASMRARETEALRALLERRDPTATS